MISRKIDLTENNDFSSTALDFSTFNGETISHALRVNSMKSMSMDDYMLLVKYEAFFGVKTHDCQAYEIFKPTVDEYRYEMESHCQRCGAPLLPWRRFNDLCHQCSSVVDVGIYGRIPWKSENYKLSNNMGRREDPKEIFSLR